MTRSKTPKAVLAMAACSLLSTGPAGAAETAALQPGAYTVEVGIEMPYPEDKSEHYTICLTKPGDKPAHGLFIVTPDTPLSSCPVGNVHESAEQITFDILCKGTNAGAASAVFEVTRDTFKGRINMLMGGKNMRLTEVQDGHRVGDCPADGVHAGR